MSKTIVSKVSIQDIPRDDTGKPISRKVNFHDSGYVSGVFILSPDSTERIPDSVMESLLVPGYSHAGGWPGDTDESYGMRIHVLDLTEPTIVAELKEDAKKADQDPNSKHTTAEIIENINSAEKQQKELLNTLKLQDIRLAAKVLLITHFQKNGLIDAKDAPAILTKRFTASRAHIDFMEENNFSNTPYQPDPDHREIGENEAIEILKRAEKYLDKEKEVQVG